MSNHPWTNPNIDGMRVKTRWASAQPLQNSYYWTSLDQALSLGSQNGKFIGLSVTAGIFSPTWLYNADATQYLLRDGSGLAMPLPWDDAFLTQWVRFVRALGQRYDGNPALRYVVISGMGQQDETCMAEGAADDAALVAMGGAPAWVTAAKKIIVAYADAFPTTPFFMTMAKPFSSDNGGDTALQEVVEWGLATYPGRFGLMTARLSVTSTTRSYPNNSIYTHSATQPAGFQMLASYIDDNGLRLGGTLNQVLTNGVQLRAKFVEVYEDDVLDPSQQSVLAKQDGDLEANVNP